jgi:predicted transcriptional regulator
MRENRGKQNGYMSISLLYILIKMGLRCETIGKYILPIFRSLVARELINAYKLTQVETAKKLGTTQAAVSQYINSKRALKGMKQIGELLPQIRDIAKKTAKRLANSGLTLDDVSVDFCDLCSSFCKVESSQIVEDYVI